MTDTATDTALESQLRPKRRRRRWLQYSLRSLLVLVVLVSAACSWYAVTMHRVTKQREALAAFRKFPGIITYGYERAGQKTPPGPAWLRRLMGDDAFAQVDFVCLGCNEEFTDETLAHVRWLPELRVLRIGRAAVSDDGLRYLEDLPQLEVLALHGTRITDVGLQRLTRMKQLKQVVLTRTRVTADGVQRLREALPQCDVSWKPPEPEQRPSGE